MSNVMELIDAWKFNDDVSVTHMLELRRAIEADEAEAAKSHELPPLPDDVRAIVDQLRRSHITSGQVHRLVSFIDATFPKPKTQAELDAAYLERGANGHPLDKEGLLRIAKRLREGKAT